MELIKEIEKSKHVCIDTNIFSYYFTENQKYFNKIRKILVLAEEGKINIITSVVTMLEVMSMPNIENNRVLQENYYSVFKYYPNLTLVDVNVDIVVIAASLRRKYHLKTPDAILLATAINSKCDLFLTNDLRLKQVKEIKIVTLDKK